MVLQMNSFEQKLIKTESKNTTKHKSIAIIDAQN